LTSTQVLYTLTTELVIIQNLALCA